MALTVVKYNRKSVGATSSTTGTPGILMKSKVQSQSAIKHQAATSSSTPAAADNKKSLIKLGSGSGLVINKIPAIIKPAMKRTSTVAGDLAHKTAKYSLQTIASAGTPLTSFQWQQTIGGSSASSSSSPTKKQQLGAAISSLPPNTIIKATSANSLQSSNGTAATLLSQNITSSAVVSPVTSMQVRRPTFIIKRDVPERTIRTITLELIEKSPLVHLGIPSSRLPLLKNVICSTANVSLVDCYLTLKKLKQNEDFSLLAEYFEMSEGDVQHTFARTVVRLGRYLRFLINWPDSKKYYDRHKNLPFAFRQNLSHVQSLIECVEVDMAPSPLQIDCACFKFILSINTNGIISHISDAFIGHHDDLTVFKVSNFKDTIPKYLSLVADPGKAVRRKRKPKAKQSQQQKQQQQQQQHVKTSNMNKNGETDSTTDSADESADDLIQNDESSQEGRLTKYAASRVAGELASNQCLTVVNSELTSRRLKNYSVPTMRVREPVCRLQMRQMVDNLQEFRILQPLSIKEPLVYQYLNEVLIVCAALINLQR